VIRQLIGWCLVIAAWAVVLFIIITAAAALLTPNPDAPERPRTWPTTRYTDVPLIPPPGDPGPV
jgi:hypothetical protein